MMTIRRLSLIGMSGSGKSIWSIKLSELGFKRFCCDDMITEKLAHELMRPNGTSMQLGEWMGFPYETDYERRESKYLDCEIKVLTGIIEYLESADNQSQPHIVIDTTGSAIYAGEALLKRLCQCTTVVHLATPPEAQEQMLTSYINNKRPVLWRGLFKKGPNETNEAALARCYPILLSSRELLYESISEVTIGYDTLYQDGFGANDFLKEIIGNLHLHERDDP